MANALTSSLPTAGTCPTEWIFESTNIAQTPVNPFHWKQTWLHRPLGSCMPSEATSRFFIVMRTVSFGCTCIRHSISVSLSFPGNERRTLVTCRVLVTIADPRATAPDRGAGRADGITTYRDRRTLNTNAHVFEKINYRQLRPGTNAVRERGGGRKRVSVYPAHSSVRTPHFSANFRLRFVFVCVSFIVTYPGGKWFACETSWTVLSTCKSWNPLGWTSNLRTADSETNTTVFIPYKVPIVFIGKLHKPFTIGFL